MYFVIPKIADLSTRQLLVHLRTALSNGRVFIMPSDAHICAAKLSLVAGAWSVYTVKEMKV